jgi:hypothetical protein
MISAHAESWGSGAPPGAAPSLRKSSTFRGSTLAVVLLISTAEWIATGLPTEEARMDENQHPKGALLFMLLYLLTLTALWLNAYLRLWRS